jgi:hypothetical protein
LERKTNDRAVSSDAGGKILRQALQDLRRCALRRTRAAIVIIAIGLAAGFT